MLNVTLTLWSPTVRTARVFYSTLNAFYTILNTALCGPACISCVPCAAQHYIVDFVRKVAAAGRFRQLVTKEEALAVLQENEHAAVALQMEDGSAAIKALRATAYELAVIGAPPVALCQIPPTGAGAHLYLTQRLAEAALDLKQEGSALVLVRAQNGTDKADGVSVLSAAAVAEPASGFGAGALRKAVCGWAYRGYGLVDTWRDTHRAAVAQRCGLLSVYLHTKQTVHI